MVEQYFLNLDNLKRFLPKILLKHFLENFFFAQRHDHF